MVYRKISNRKTRKTSKNKKFRGGFVSSPAAYPQGSFFSSDISSWPGVSGNTTNSGNHYEYNSDVNPLPVSTSNVYSGGKKSKTNKRKLNKRKTKKHNKKSKLAMRKKINKSHKRKYKGGDNRSSYFPQSIVNLGRNTLFQGHELVNSWQGLPASDSPMPTEQPIGDNTLNIPYSAVNVDAIHSAAEQTVTKL